MLISLPFLILTFIVYGSISELRNLHGKCLMSYIVAITILYIGLIVVNLANDWFIGGEFPCLLLGYLIYIGTHLCFFWLNVMCFVVHMAFKVEKRTTRDDERQFKFFSCYAFGVPILMTFIVYFIDLTEFVPLDYRPEIGVNACFVKTDPKAPQMIYIHIPIAILLFINIVLYSITAYKVYKHRTMKKISKNTKKMEDNKEIFTIYFRLFLMNGATWMMESISFFTEPCHSSLLYRIFYITDILNCLQGIIIFILFVCKENVRKTVMNK